MGRKKGAFKRFGTTEPTPMSSLNAPMESVSKQTSGNTAISQAQHEK